MQACFTVLGALAVAVLVMMTLIRWFEQTAEAVDNGWWNKVVLLVAAPFAVWFFPSRVAAGRPTMVPRHEPVRGFGKVKLTEDAPKAVGGNGDAPSRVPPPVAEGPPPGTPKEFLGMPVVPPKKASKKPAVDPEKLAKLRQKMREQGMLPGEGEAPSEPPSDPR
jgi:hypothetical protein